MDYKELNDNELIYLISENNEEATELLIKKYKNLITIILKECTSNYNINGLELADLYQEGLIGLLTAIDTFNKEKNILFYTYATVCIRTSILSEIRKSFRNKNRILNNSCSLDSLFDNRKDNLYEIIKDEGSDPSKILDDKESKDELINKITKLLSKNEKVIFDLKLKGASNKEIATLLNKEKKQIENTLFRISKKYKDNKDKITVC